MGIVVYAVAIWPLHRASTLTKVIATLAVLVSLQWAVVLIFGPLPKLPTPFLPTRSVHLGPIAVGENSLLFLGFTVLLTIALWAAYKRTRFGLATSALAENARAPTSASYPAGSGSSNVGVTTDQAPAVSVAAAVQWAVVYLPGVFCIVAMPGGSGATGSGCGF